MDNFGDVTLSPSISASGILLSSTPRSTRRQLQGPTFRRPFTPTANTVLATCPRCFKVYRSLKFYEKHLQSHTLKDAASRIPDVGFLQENASVIGDRALKGMSQSPATGKWGPSYNKLVENLKEEQSTTEWKEFVNCLTEHFNFNLRNISILMPSSILSQLLQDVEKILTDFTTRLNCLELLRAVPCCRSSEAEVLQFFLCDFTFKFCDEFFILLSRTLRDASRAENQESVIIDEEDRQTIHFVAGSVLKGFLRMGRRYPSNRTWQAIVTAVREKVIENPDIAPAADKDRMWTELMSRGALTFVGGDTLEFFVCVAKILVLLEYKDRGNLPHDVVLEAVVKGEAKYLWDSIIGNSLPEDLSLRLMEGVTKSFTQTYGRGVAMKRINAVHKNQPYSSVTTRHRLAPR